MDARGISMGELEKYIDKKHAGWYDTRDVCESVGMVDKHV